MIIDPVSSLSSAVAAATRNAAETEAAALTPEANPSGVNFADFINSVGTNFADSLKAAETKSMDGMLGKASTREVVEAVMSADQTLQTAMAFRDKIVSAYLEIVKMPI
ncbi:MAG: flagellar hook-basal body complex protein FliE [Rhizobium sp.]|nr:flagellar hook-basal body complex protein FliE [Rhizobium sp.]